MINRIFKIYDGENVNARQSGGGINLFIYKNGAVHKGRLSLDEGAASPLSPLSKYIYSDEVIELDSRMIERRGDKVKFTQKLI